MKPDYERELERLIDGELRRLPQRPAPDTLVHRVMLAVHARARAPWWQRPAAAWPFAMQLAALLMLLLTSGLVSYFAAAMWEGLSVTSAMGSIAESAAWLEPVWEAASALTGAAVVLLRLAGQQFVLFGAAMLVIAYLTCVGIGTACVRLAYNKA